MEIFDVFRLRGAEMCVRIARYFAVKIWFSKAILCCCCWVLFWQLYSCCSPITRWVGEKKIWRICSIIRQLPQFSWHTFLLRYQKLFFFPLPKEFSHDENQKKWNYIYRSALNWPKKINSPTLQTRIWWVKHTLFFTGV